MLLLLAVNRNGARSHKKLANSISMMNESPKLNLSVSCVANIITAARDAKQSLPFYYGTVTRTKKLGLVQKYCGLDNRQEMRRDSSLDDSLKSIEIDPQAKVFRRTFLIK